jgi:hypothetical protein
MIWGVNLENVAKAGNPPFVAIQNLSIDASNYVCNDLAGHYNAHGHFFGKVFWGSANVPHTVLTERQQRMAN